MGWPYQQKPPSGWPIDYDSGLVPDAGFWPFLEGSGGQVFDLSGNGNTGTFVADTHWVPGKFGPALDFDGTGDYVDLSSYISKFGPLSQGTICFWVRAAATTDYILNLSDISTNNNLFAFGILVDKLYVLIKAASGTDIIRASSTAVINAVGNWRFLCYTSGLSGNAFYVDGVQVAVTYTTGNAATQGFFSRAYTQGNNDLLCIGRLQIDAVTNDFTGLIDNGMIYNRVLTDAEIALLYREPFCMFKDPAEILLNYPWGVAATIVPQIQYLRNMGLVA